MEAAIAPPEDRQKALGAFYTPPEIAAQLAQWAIRSTEDLVLDPSFGGLAFLDAAAARLQGMGLSGPEASARLWGVDIDSDAMAAAANTGTPLSNLVHEDFFAVAPGEVPAVDVLLGNPPYIRYQAFNGSGERARELASAAGVRITKLASSWAPFVVHGTSFISPGGRMAQVLPAEILHAQYATEVLEFLRREFGSVSLVTFEERVFPGALEEVVLLLADRRGEAGRADIQLLSCKAVDDLDLSTPSTRSDLVEDELGAESLLAQLLPAEARRLLVRLAVSPQVVRLGALASVDIGIVTGANEFFMLPCDRAEPIADDLLRAGVSKAAHIPGARLDREEHADLLAGGGAGMIFVATLSEEPATLETARLHIRDAEKLGLQDRYKCRIRNPWWSLPVPAAGPPELLLTYCSNDFPRLTLNEVGALHTNTLHAVRPTDPALAATLAASFYNSLTLLSCELEGRSYGGGVLKLEPSEAERLLIPEPAAGNEALLNEVDDAVRARNLQRVLDLVDQAVLIDGCGLTEDDVAALREGRKQLADRRRSRGRAPAGT
ncbi:MAG: N-6 DNA methylase [Solirubrobacterales bacterium]